MSAEVGESQIRINIFRGAMLFLAVIFLIFAGFNSQSLLLEKSARYVSTHIKNFNCDSFPIIIQSNEQNELQPLPSSLQEFRETYGVFGENRLSFLPTININKDSTFFIEDIPSSCAYSALFFETDSIVEYDGCFRHQYFPIDFMFGSKETKIDQKQLCYISQEDANTLLSRENKKASEENYASLIGRELKVIIDGVKQTFVVSNIFTKGGMYYSEAKELLGNFIILAKTFPKSVKLEFCYFLNSQVFQNCFFMKRIKRIFGSNSFSAHFLNKKTQNEFDNKYAANFFYSNNNILAFTLFFLVSIISYLLFCVSFFIKKTAINHIFLIISISVLIITYLTFVFVDYVFNSETFFGFFSYYMLAIYILLFLPLFLPNIKGKKQLT